MENGSEENPNGLNSIDVASKKIRDIINQPILIHSSPYQNLRTILLEGILSPNFKKRTGMTSNNVLLDDSSDVFMSDTQKMLPLTRDLLDYWIQPRNGSPSVGLIIDRSIPIKYRVAQESAQNQFAIRNLRIAPRFIKGVIVNQELPGWKDVIDTVDSISRKFPQLSVPIYNTEGNVIWPKDLSIEAALK